MSFLTGENTAINAACKTLNLKVPTCKQRKILQKVFGVKHYRSFDLIKCPAECDLGDEISIEQNAFDIRFVELKSTKHLGRYKKSGRGFTIRFTDNEIDTAKRLGSFHKVLIWDIHTNDYVWDNLLSIMGRATNIATQHALTYRAP